MDKKIPLARTEEKGRSVLLAGTGTGLSKQESLRGAEGKETASNPQRNEKGKASTAKKKGKGDTKTKAGNGRGRKRGRTYSLRGTIRDIEGVNRPSRRSAKEMGITWLDYRCEESPVTKAHYLIGKTKIDSGTVFKCIYCHRVKWLPNSMRECQRLGTFLHTYGLNGGYQRILDLHPAAKRLISKIQDIYYLKKSVSAKQFPVVVAAVIMDREYPHDVEIKEEEIL